MNAHETTQNQARQIFEAGDSFAKCCEAAAGEFCRRQSCEAKANRWNRFRPIADGEENPGANATRLAEDEDENAGGDSDSGVISCEATRQETLAEFSAKILREFCDRLGVPRQIFVSEEIHFGGTLRGTGAFAVRRRLRGPQDSGQQSPAAAE